MLYPWCCFIPPREGSHVSSHYSLCVWSERAAVCQSLENLPAPLLPECSLWVCAVEARCWLVSLLSRALPRPCLSVCLPVCFRLPACLSISSCHLAASVALWGLTTSVLLQGFKNDTSLGLLADDFTHASLLVSASCAVVDFSLCLLGQQQWYQIVASYMRLNLALANCYVILCFYMINNKEISGIL